MKVKSLVLIGGLLVILAPANCLPALVVAFGDGSNSIQDVYLDASSAREAETTGFRKCSEEILTSLSNALCNDPSMRIYLSYQTTLSKCDTAEMIRCCLINHGVPAEKIVVFEMPAENVESCEGSVELSLVEIGGQQLSMVR